MNPSKSSAPLRHLALTAALAIFPATVLAAPPSAEEIAAARERAMEEAISASVRETSEMSDRSGVQIKEARRMMWLQRLRETIGRDRAMRNIAPTPHGDSKPPDGMGAPARRRGPKQQTFAIHADNSGYDSSGVWREGIFYANRDLTGGGDLLMLSYIRSKGVDSVSTGYAVPIGGRTTLDLDYLTNTVEIVGKERAREIQGHAYSVGANLHQLLVKNRDKRIEAGLMYSHSHLSSDMGKIPVLEKRVSSLDSNLNRAMPYLELINYGKSSLIYQRHGVAFGRWSDISGSHKGYTSYQLDFMYEKDYAHGQKVTGRAAAQLSDREGLSSADRFYIGGPSNVRGYKTNHISGDNGFFAGAEYGVPLGVAKGLSAFLFMDYGRVSGGLAPRDSAMWGTGVGVAYDRDDIHASLTLGVPLRREVGYAGDHEMSKTRVHFMVHAMF